MLAFRPSASSDNVLVTLSGDFEDAFEEALDFLPRRGVDPRDIPLPVAAGCGCEELAHGSSCIG